MKLNKNNKKKENIKNNIIILFIFGGIYVYNRFVDLSSDRLVY